MSIKLKWANAYNGNVSGFRVYRSATKANLFDAANLLQEFATTTLDYEDTTIQPDTVYYYGVESLTPLGTMQSKPILAIQYVNSAGPGGINVTRGSMESGMLDATSATNMPDLFGASNSVLFSALSTQLTVLNRTTSSIVPGQYGSLVSKLTIGGKVYFMPADFMTYGTFTSAAQRQTFDTTVASILNDGVFFEYQGFRLRMQLMDLDHAMQYWSKNSGGPTNLNGWMIRSVEQPIPAYANHYVLAQKDGKLYRLRAPVGARPYIMTAVEATLTDAFATNAICYPLYVMTPAD